MIGEPCIVEVALNGMTTKAAHSDVLLYATLFGLPPTLPSLEAYLAMLDSTRLAWSVAVLGGDVVGCGLAALALERGGHIRVGLVDYAGPRAPSNVELVAGAAALITASDRRVATAAEARARLG